MRALSIALLLAAAVAAASFCVVILDEREIALRTVLGDPDSALNLGRAVLDRPGLHLRVPGLHTLERFDKRLQRYDADLRELQLANNYLIRVDYYLTWRIENPRRLREAVRAGELSRILDDTAYNEVRTVLGQHPIEALLSERSSGITREIADRVAAKLAPLGIAVVDLQVRRSELPESNLERTFGRMRAERDRIAQRFRAEGEGEARRLRSEADRESVRIRAEAERRAAELRGEGDARSAAIYAQAYGQDPAFYSFRRTLEAYGKTLGERTTIVLSQKSPFLRPLFERVPDAAPTPGAR